MLTVGRAVPVQLESTDKEGILWDMDVGMLKDYPREIKDGEWVGREDRVGINREWEDRGKEWEEWAIVPLGSIACITQILLTTNLILIPEELCLQIQIKEIISHHSIHTSKEEIIHTQTSPSTLIQSLLPSISPSE